jgi:acyl transferase domain-containing protein
MDPILSIFKDCLEKIIFNKPCIPFISNVSGDWITDSQAIDPDYWVSHLRQAVQFSKGMATLAKTQNRFYLEIGQASILCNLARDNLNKNEGIASSLGYANNPRNERYEFLTCIKQLWAQGICLNWKNFTAQHTARRISLPTYAFERKSYWIEPCWNDYQSDINFGTVEIKQENSDKGEKIIEISVVQEDVNRKKVSTSYVAPETDKQIEMATIWEKFLGVDGVGITDNYFELGGDSLLAVQINKRIKTNMGIDIPMSKLFELATIRKIVNYWEITEGNLPVDALSEEEVDEIIETF